MFSIRHPEEPRLGSEGPETAARTFADGLRQFEVALAARMRNGGKSDRNRGQTRVIRAVVRVSGRVFHRLLDFSSCSHGLLPHLPLSTTITHILAVSRLLSRRNLKARTARVHHPAKVPVLAVYQ